MTIRKPKSIKNMQKVFDKLLKYVENNEIDRECVAKGFDQILEVFYAESPGPTQPTVEGLVEIWELFMDEAAHSVYSRKTLSEQFNRMLDELFSNDFFGTEGQCDPRGDHRD